MTDFYKTIRGRRRAPEGRVYETAPTWGNMNAGRHLELPEPPAELFILVDCNLIHHWGETCCQSRRVRRMDQTK
eukprot:5532376-Pyramimonas_sp.AAC.1